MLRLADVDDRFLDAASAVGQAWTQAPQETHSESHERLASPARYLELEAAARRSVRAKVPWTSSQARTQREQTMHLRRVEGEVRVATRPSCACEVVGALVAVAHVAQPDGAGHVLQLAVAVGRAGEAIQRMVGDVELHHAAAQLRRARVCVWTFMPGATGVVHEAGVPGGPRSRPGRGGRSRTASRMSVAHSFGIVDAGLDRRAHDRRAGRHGDLRPSIVQRDRFVGLRCGGAVVDLVRLVSWRPSSSAAATGAVEIFRENASTALQHRERRQAAQRAERTVHHHLAKIVE